MRWRHRRRAPRRAGHWAARYRVDPDGPWWPCLIVDLSLGGAAVELDDPTATLDGRIELDVRPLPSGAPGFVLAGEVRNARAGAKGGPRIGVEFVDMSDVARHVLTDLLSLESL